MGAASPAEREERDAGDERAVNSAPASNAATRPRDPAAGVVARGRDCAAVPSGVDGLIGSFAMETSDLPQVGDGRASWGIDLHLPTP
ncbi:hypothetical protein [Halorubrum ezzemoulense]|uniref:hypothetical protein n=1 Tax=Halorubrum ezzemoulense TaxID=337243 RepID=UPI003D7D7DC4